MAAPMCRGKLLAVKFFSRNLQVHLRSLPLTLKPVQFYSRSICSCPRFSLHNETASSKTLLQGTGMYWLKMYNTSLGSKILSCHKFSSSASTSDDGSTTRPHESAKLPTTVKIKTLDTVGQRIRPGTIHLFDQDGSSMGAIHSYQAVKLANDPKNTGLKLLLIDAEAKPYPAYQLMTSQQLLEERAKLREEKKASKGEGTVQSMRFSSDITTHDLSHKVKKIDGFLEKKASVKISINNPRSSTKTTQDMVKLADNILKSLSTKATYQTPPTVKGTGVICVLRPLSDKETSTGKKK